MEHPIFLARGISCVELLRDDLVRTRTVGGHGDTNRRGFEQLQELQRGRFALGRYQLEEAAMLIEGRLEASSMLVKLKRAVLEGKLPTYAPARNERYQASTVREWYEEVYWDDLNTWLDAEEKRTVWRFPNPTSETPPTAPPTVQPSAYIESASSADGAPVVGLVPGGVTKAEIIGAFPPPGGRTPDAWEKALGDAKRIVWLKPARIDAGAPGTSALWNPAVLAQCICDEYRATPQQRRDYGRIIRRYFPAWLPEWEAYAESYA